MTSEQKQKTSDIGRNAEKSSTNPAHKKNSKTHSVPDQIDSELSPQKTTLESASNTPQENTPQEDAQPITDDQNPKFIYIDEKQVELEPLIQEYKSLKKEFEDKEHQYAKIIKRRRQEQRLKPFQAELIRMQQYLEEQQRGMIIVFEGRDAAGKSGAVRRVSRYMNEKHYRVVALGKPTREQLSQWYFQKYVAHFPRGGEVVLFDRSWYNRAMIERVFKFCAEEEYQNFIRGVTGFEKDIVRQGTLLVKLYFSVTKEEQARRFRQRENDPLQKWKFEEVDWQVQDRWDEFTEQKYQILKHTSTHEAPWVVIRSDSKPRARLNAMKVILNAVPYNRLDKSLNFIPEPEFVISAPRELELMEAQRRAVGKFVD
jgi:polyphosphate kinase 2